jgi:predicted phosphodiesterase
MLMKIAILSDIHGNLPALQAVTADIEAWQPDMVIVAGDIVNGGPSSKACTQEVQRQQDSNAWQVLRGNHEDYVIEWATPGMTFQGPRYELSQLSHWTYQRLNGEVDYLAALPDRCGWQAPDGSSLLILHASIWGNRAGIYPWTAEEEMRRKIAPYPTVFVTAHTHIPFQRRLDETLLINVGSVGLPGDGDWRAGYGRLTWTRNNGWQAQIRRVSYDRKQTEKDYISSGFLAEAGPGAWLTLVELRSARDAKTRWASIYRERILAGEISIEDTVQEFLSLPEFRVYLD